MDMQIIPFEFELISMMKKSFQVVSYSKLLKFCGVAKMISFGIYLHTERGLSYI